MSRNRGTWIRRREQAGAEAAIGQVIERHPLSDDSIEDLAQGMCEVGFQGADCAFTVR